MQWLTFANLSYEEFRSAIRRLLAKHVSSAEIGRQLIEEYGDGVRRVQRVRKWRTVTKWPPTMMLAA
jgi:hypothetical protein